MCGRSCGAVRFGVSVNIGKCITRDAARRDPVYSAGSAHMQQTACLLWRRRGGICVWCLIGLLSPHPRNSGNQMPSSVWGQALGCVRFSPEAAAKAQEGQSGFAILPLLKSGPACVLNTSLLLLIELGQLQHSALCLLYVTSPSDHRLHLICQMLPFRQGSGPTERCFCHLLSTFDCSFGS